VYQPGGNRFGACLKDQCRRRTSSLIILAGCGKSVCGSLRSAQWLSMKLARQSPALNAITRIRSRSLDQDSASHIQRSFAGFEHQARACLPKRMKFLHRAVGMRAASGEGNMSGTASAKASKELIDREKSSDGRQRALACAGRSAFYGPAGRWCMATKWPSITSTMNPVAAGLVDGLHPLHPIGAKSAERIEGQFECVWTWALP